MNHFAYSYKQSNWAEGKQIPQPVHLIMNLAHHLKLHHTRNIYLQGLLDTCIDVNIMPASIYQLLFKDPEMKKIKPCKMQISMYTAVNVKIIGSCIFDVVHLDAKKLVPVTFYVANNNGSVLLSCKTTLALQLIQPQLWLDYLLTWASPITSTKDHPKKTKMTVLKVHQSKQEVSDQRQQPPSKALTSKNTDQKQDQAIMIISKEQILLKYPDTFEGITDFQVCHTTYKSIRTLPWNKLCVGQYWSTLKKPSKKKLTRCFKLVSSDQLQKPPHG